MNLFSYIVKEDTGFAPNPFWGYCTLACCKPVIRRKAVKGDIVVGLSPKKTGNKIVYIMRVTDKLTFGEYWNIPKFARKKPDRKSKAPKAMLGDNIYRPLANDKFRQVHSAHSNDDGTEKESTKKKDLSGGFVLVSDDFVYFGQNAEPLPVEFKGLIAGRGHCRFSSPESQKLIADFEDFFAGLPRGYKGMPTDWENEMICPMQKK